MKLFDTLSLALQAMWTGARPEDRRRWRRNRRKTQGHRPGLPLACLQQLEARLCLSPVANNDTYNGNLFGTTNIPAAQGVLANDTGSSLTAILVSGPSDGHVTLNSNGSFTYTNSQMTSGDHFTYKDFDGTNYSGTATVTIHLSNNGAVPTAQNQGTYDVVHDHTLTLAAPGILTGDSDPNGIPLTASLVAGSGPSHGTLTLHSDGSLSYVPNSHYAGQDSFGYEAYNGYQYSSQYGVTIDVTNQAPTANNASYTLSNNNTLNVSAANGVLATDSDADGDTLTASLTTSPSHGTVTLNSDGSFSYTPNPGWVGYDGFGYAASDGVASTDASVSLHTMYSVLSAVDQTKVPVDTIHVSQQILSDPFNSPITSPLPAGGSGGTTISATPADGAPATAHNLSLVYDSVLAQPDQVIEAEIGLSNANPMAETLTATLTFNGTAQPSVYFNMNTMTGSSGQVHFAQQIDTSGLASGRYPWSLTVTSPDMAAPATISGYVNVVNDSASPFGKGWDMPGLYRLFNNNVSGVPAGVVLSTGDGGGWYYTQGSGSTYTSPAGPFAFSTLTSVTGGGWQLVTHTGITFNFNSSGYLTSRVERTGQTTSYTWSGSDMTAITDQFGRSLALSYANGLLSSIQDFAGSTWSIADTGSNLTSITEPNPGYSTAPQWQYSYSGNYMSSETDPNGNESQFSLDSFHRLSGTTLPDSSTTSDVSEQDFGYGSTNSSSPASLTMQTAVLPSTTDGLGYTSGYQTDQFGNVTSETDPYGNTTVITRDANGLPTVITLPPPTMGAANPVTDLYYDSTGDETYATGAGPTYGTFTYAADSFGQWATFTDSLGKEWVRTFDSSGNILTETTPSGNEVSWSYNSYGQPLTMTVPAPRAIAP